MLHINSREHLKQRQEVKPLTMDELETIGQFLNQVLSESRNEMTSSFEQKALDVFEGMLQRFIWNYENYQHFFIISQSKADNMEVQYETVESKMNNDE